MRHADNDLAAAVALLQQLIRIPSYSGSESEAQLVFAHHLEKLGMSTEVDSFRTSTLNSTVGPCVTARLPGTGAGRGRSIVLNSHMDVVSAGRPEQWTLGGPFEAALSAGRVVGRGAADAKGCLVAFYLALKLLRSTGIRLQGDVTLQSVSDEERGGYGTSALLEQGVIADAVIIGEPTDLTICPGARGFMTFRCTIDCATGHPGAISERPSAATVGATVLYRFIRETGKAVAERLPVHPLWARAGISRSSVITQVATNSSVSGAVDRMEFVGLIEMLPGDKSGTVRLTVEALVDGVISEYDFAEVESSVRWLETVEGCATEVDSSIVTTFTDAVATTGLDVAVRPFPAASDMHHFVERGFPAVHFGPGRLARAHGPNEYLEIAELSTAAICIGQLLCDWCGVAN
jgi:acetylornithine deacetylase